jgi:peptidoglycan/LPS O-acetylase OafA/YrhL
MGRGPESHSLIPILNGFRAYAILAIVVFHLLWFASPPFDYGRAVWMALGGHLDTFFIASGCALFLPVVRDGHLDTRAYARRRFARVVPTYWLTLSLILVVIAATGDPFPGAVEIAVQYTGLQTPAHLIDAGLPIGFGVDQPLWLLSLIFGLYVLLGLAWRPYLRHPLIGLALAASVTVVWKLAVAHMTGVFSAIEGHTVPDWMFQRIVADQLPGFLFSFCLGMTGAWAYVRFAEPRSRDELKRIAVWAAPAVLAGVVACAYLYSELAMAAGGPAGGAAARTSIPLVLGMSVFRAAAIGVVAIGPALWAKAFTNRLAGGLSETSYGLYAIHFVIAIYVGERLIGLPQDGSAGAVALWLAVVIPPSLAFGYLATRFVERPVRAWAKSRSTTPRVRLDSPRTLRHPALR